MREIATLDQDRDRTHDAEGDPTFQESSLIVWHDLAAGIGGVWRVSQEPVNARMHSCFGIFTHDGLRFRDNVSEVPFAPENRGDHYMALGDVLRLDLAEMSISANFPDCTAELQFEDLHPRWDYLSLMQFDAPEGHRGAHLEAAGRITGTVRIGGREIAVNAFGHRDRSWGSRHWGTLRATRWWSIVYGPDLAVQMTAHVHAHGEHGTLGYVVRDGVPTLMTRCEIETVLDYDAIGVSAAFARCTLETGEELAFEHRRTSGVILDVKNFRATESIGTVRLGDRVGASNIEVFSNALGGLEPPAFVMHDDYNQGLSRRV